ncbi:MAG: ATP-binding protein [Phycisphaerales bacterium]|jgi:serine/threonine-protein kinase RsbW|nr:ATP-binding protein [Phycisphaerales bacterium]
MSSEFDPSWRRQWRIGGEREACLQIINQTQQAIESAGLGGTVAFAVRLAMEEAMVNAIRHGHGGDESLEIKVQVSVDASEISVAVEDMGPGFDPDAVPDPTAEENLTIASGRGLTLMRAFMTEVEVVPPGNRIEMRYVAK